MNQYCFLNGEIVPLAKAKVSVLDIGLLRGYGIYDGLSVINGKVLRFEDHWQRFERGAKALNLKIPVTKKVLEQKIIEITDKSGLSKRSNIRLILTGGETILGIEYDFDNPTFYAVAEKWNPLPDKCFQKGVKLVSFDYQRELPEIKTINYVTAVNLQNFRKENNALEILYTHNELVLECATSNIFIVKDGAIITPLENVLEGITSKIVQELVVPEYNLEKRDISKEELKSADEVFITSSFKDVVPVTTIDDYTVGNGEVGPVTKGIM
ncbi:MAG: hypothetical protein COV96_01730, partial [Candidatus Zambryskibacteria bacterium CG11_big_fil_rev_8_21_14_0_20_42_18]